MSLLPTVANNNNLNFDRRVLSTLFSAFCLPILMLLYIMLYIVLAYLMLYIVLAC